MESTSDFEEIVSAWQIGDVVTWHKIRDGIHRIEAAHGATYVLKLVGAENEKAKQRLQFEYEVLQHVRRSDISVAIPLLSEADTPYFTAAGKIYRLSQWLPNQPAEINTVDAHERMVRNYGTAIARIHLALAEYKDNALADKTWQIDLQTRIFEQAVPQILTGLDEKQRSEFRSLFDPIKLAMISAVSDLPTQLVLWDCHAGNMTVDGLEVSGFIDCDHICIAPRVFDLADFLVHLIKWDIGDESKETSWLRNIAHFVAGYESVSPLFSQERDSLYYVMAGVPLIFMDFFVQSGLQEPLRTELDLFRFLLLHQNEISTQVG